MRTRRAVPLIAATLGVLLAVAPVTASLPATNQWAAVGGVQPAFGAGVSALVWGSKTGPDGRLYVYGSFVNAGGDPTADFLAAYDPANGGWSGIGSDGLGNGAFKGVVYDIAWLGGKLYAVGSFTDVAGVALADYFAVWNGSSWSARGAGPVAAFAAGITSIDVQGNKVYVAGGFTNADGIDNADAVAVWDGEFWSGLGDDGAGGGALVGTAIKVDARPDGKVYAGGNFISGADPRISRIGYFDPATATWMALRETGTAGPALANGVVYDIELIGTRVYATGTFINASGHAAADYLAVWNGSAWGSVGSNPANPDSAPLDAGAIGLTAYGSNLIVTGSFSNAGGNANADRVAAWNGSTWLNLGVPNLSPGDAGVFGSISGRSYTLVGSFASVASKAGTNGVARFGLPAGPSAPRSPAAVSGSRRVTVRWSASASANGATIRNYVVQARRLGTSTWATKATVGATVRSVTVTGLTSGVTYQFRVLAKNDWGLGTPSLVITKRAR